VTQPLRLPVFLCRVYVFACLVAAGILSPLVWAVIPWLLVPLFVFLEFKKSLAGARVALSLLLLLCVPLFFEPLLGPWISPALGLPVVALLDHSLKQYSRTSYPSPGIKGLRPTGLCIRLGLSLAAVFVVALFLTSPGLVISCGIAALYLALVLYAAGRRLKIPPVEAGVKDYRCIAGSRNQVPLEFFNRSGMAGSLSLASPFSWFKVSPDRFVMDNAGVEIRASFSPPLSGPESVTLQAAFTDPRGFITSGFEIEVLHLFVTSRARYAEWLAQKYLEMSKTGGLESTTATAANTRHSSRKGVEFYGLRPYQPGDTARIIDWKHSLKLQRIIVKEFLEASVERAAVLVNLSVVDDEEKDKLVSGLITTALTLAREKIPSSMGAYNHREVVTAGQMLDPRQALLRALRIAREVSVTLSPRKYLETPDVTRLRGNINRLKGSEPGPARRLGELLELEYLALNDTAARNPATQALRPALDAVGRGGNVMFISGRNHDAEAIAINRHRLKQKGHRVMVFNLKKEGLF